LQPTVVALQPGVVDELQPGLQTRFAQVPSRQVTSQPHDRPQRRLPLHESMPLQLTLQAPVPHRTSSPHEPVPLQLRLQAPVPHVTVLQLCLPLHMIVHEVLPVQLTPLLHEFCVPHITLQLQPNGQLTGPEQPPLTPQSMMQLCDEALHEVHCGGQSSASGGRGPSNTSGTAHKPSTQIRPLLQSAWVLHAN